MICVDNEMKLLKRGTFEIINQDELANKLAKSKETQKPLVIKLGIDPTAPDVHLGFAVVLRKLRQFQDLGHEIIIIIGDFTARIGDPSGKSETRPLLLLKEIEENASTYLDQFGKILDRDKTRIVYNSQWLAPLTLEDLIKLTSRYTVAQILEREDFSKRFSEKRPIGFHELLYPLMQGNDSVRTRADVELGGLDQKFNLLVGRYLQREFGQESQVCIMMPILEGLDGVQKMSKSLKNYVGINEPPDEIYGKVMSIPDELMVKYFELCTNRSMEEVFKMEEGRKNGTFHPKEMKNILAKDIVTIYHDESAANISEKHFNTKFGAASSLPDLALLADPLEISSTELIDGQIWLAKLVERLVESRREGSRLISQGAVTIDNKKVTDGKAKVEIYDGMILRVGKHHTCRIKLIQ